MATLVREKITVDKSLIEKMERVAKMGDELNYSTPAYVLGRLKAKHKASEVFEKAGIKPFTPESVDRYERRMATRNTLVFRALKAVQLYGGQALILVAAAALFGVATKLTGDAEGFAIFSGAVLAVGAVVLAIVASIGRTQLVFRSKATWINTEMARFRGEIPLYALDTMALIALAASEIGAQCQFGVASFQPAKIDYMEKLREHREAERLRALQDPFLFVQIEGTVHYVEVWNEPGFDQARQV